MSRLSGRSGLIVAIAATFVVACAGRTDAPTEGKDHDASADAEPALPPGSEDRCLRHRCSATGQGVLGKVECSRCCAGLVPIARDTVVDGVCSQAQFLDSNFCAPCGDGVCQAEQGENTCNCPEDCR